MAESLEHLDLLLLTVAKMRKVQPDVIRRAWIGQVCIPAEAAQAVRV